MDVGRVTGAAKRRRERRLRSMLRHERQTVAMELAAALHHSRDARSDVAHGALRGQKTASSGMRPEPLGEVSEPQAGIRRHTGVGFELVLDSVVPQLAREDERQVAEEWVELVDEHTGKAYFWNPLSSRTFLEPSYLGKRGGGRRGGRRRRPSPLPSDPLPVCGHGDVGKGPALARRHLVVVDVSVFMHDKFQQSPVYSGRCLLPFLRQSGGHSSCATETGTAVYRCSSWTRLFSCPIL